jgi:ATP-binding cassette subfamily F protein 3
VVFELEDGKVEVPGRTLLENASLWVERGEHVTLVGGNGSGKTTLIETLAGNHELAAGKLRKGHKVNVGYVSQHAEELTGGGNVLDAAQRATGLTPGKARALLGQFLFSGEDVMKPLHGLSGGELRRLSLAVLVNSDANMLVLDEPTNHLDVESREALEDALMSYPGSLLLVSHDRALLDAVGSRTFAIEDGTLCVYEGGWADYVQARKERKEAERAPTDKPRAKAAKPARANGKPSKNAQRAQRELEREIEAAEVALKALEEELADPAAWADPERSSDSSERHARAKRDVEELYARLEAVAG